MLTSRGTAGVQQGYSRGTAGVRVSRFGQAVPVKSGKGGNSPGGGGKWDLHPHGHVQG